MTVVLLPVIHIHGLAVVPTLALMAGVIVVGMAVTGPGRSVDLLPLPVVEGFTMGIGVIIALQQLPLLLGTPKADAESTLATAWLTVSGADWSRAWAPLAVALLVVLVDVVGHRLRPRLPMALLAITVATLAVELTGLDVARIGVLPSSLPAPSLPVHDPATLRSLLAPAVAVARKAVNVRAGARTRLASLSHAVVLLVITLAWGPLVARIPMAALAGVLVMVARRGIVVLAQGMTASQVDTTIVTGALRPEQHTHELSQALDRAVEIALATPPR